MAAEFQSSIYSPSRTPHSVFSLGGKVNLHTEFNGEHWKILQDSPVVTTPPNYQDHLLHKALRALYGVTIAAVPPASIYCFGVRVLFITEIFHLDATAGEVFIVYLDRPSGAALSKNSEDV